MQLVTSTSEGLVLSQLSFVLVQNLISSSGENCQEGVMNLKYGVRLTDEQRKELRQLTRAGEGSRRKARRAWTLLKADGGWRDAQIAEALEIHPATVAATRKRFAEEGLDRALNEDARPGRPRKLDDRGEAHLIALACSDPPDGHDHWTLRLLAGRTVELGLVDSISHEGVRKRLKKTGSSRGRRKPGAFPR